jgi:hypothetical protein
MAVDAIVDPSGTSFAPRPTLIASMSKPTFAPRASHRLVSACLGSMFVAFGCDPDDGRPETVIKGDAREEEILDAFDEPLAEAAAHVRNESNWVQPDPDAPNDTGAQDDGGQDSGAQDDGGQDSGGDSGAGASCAGSCGGAAADESCYCDAECGSNGDCCSDYAEQCGGGGDGGGGDDGGGAGSCAGGCGDVGSDGACYCDAQCSSNGDCCGDYDQYCAGSDDGGGGAATCAGYCEGVGSDGTCYCDAECETNGDCCGDYVDACAVGNEVEPSLGFASPRQPMAGDGACWGVITDPVDVDRIMTAAAVGGTLFGTSCVAVLVVPAGAGAVPTAGLSVGAAALACSTSAVGGAAGGAIVDLVGQKMGSIAECSGSVMSAVLQIFPWGAGEKVEVPIYGTTTPADPGNCTPDEKNMLQTEVNDVCKNAGTRSCTNANTCETIAAKIDLAAQCIDARQKINSQCFDGGDAGHNTAVQQEVNLQNNCYELSTAAGC